MGKATKPTIDMAADFGPVEQVVTAPPQNVVQQGTEGRPFCERHNCLMVAQSTKGAVTYYSCPVPGCTCTAKKARPTTPVPAAPQKCQFTSCREPAQYLERDESDKSIGQMTMVCPRCGNKQYVPRPTYQAKPPKLIAEPTPAGFDER